MKILSPLNQFIIGIFFDLGEDRFTELNSGSPYYLTIYIVYTGVDSPTARPKAEKCSEKIKELFINTFGPHHKAEEIVLENCLVVPETDFSLDIIQRSDQWRLEYISFRETPVAPHLPIQ